MKLGLQIPRFTFPDLGPTLARVARTADDAGFASLWLMDHLFQIRSLGTPEESMLEAYTTLGFLAAHTSRATLGTLVTGVPYRHAGMLIKQVTTLDVLSGGRAWLGIGAGWYEREARGLGLPFPRVAERFELLEDTLRLAHHMWLPSVEPFSGRHVQAQEPMNNPPPISQPRPRIMVGGGGERKTLRLVAQYADACNLFARLPSRDLQRKLDVLRSHCDRLGRNDGEIEKTALTHWDPLRKPDRILEQLEALKALGFQSVIGSVRDVQTLEPIEAMARAVIPRAAEL
jgi:F420-dependent oxidoreductase-like protein